MIPETAMKGNLRKGGGGVDGSFAPSTPRSLRGA